MEYNLYAFYDGNRFTDIIMPDATGELQGKAPEGTGWYTVKWPVNPHFTGEAALKELLSMHFQAARR